jgi:hypothetical protein
MDKWLRLAAVFALACSLCACKKLQEIREGPGGPLPFGEGGKEPASAAGVEGKYTGSGTNPEGGSYKCDVTVSRKGDAYAVTWYFDGKLGYEGTGILKGNTFVVGFAGPRGYGVVAYTVKADGSLDGTWAGKGGSKLGTEKLTQR